MKLIISLLFLSSFSIQTKDTKAYELVLKKNNADINYELFKKFKSIEDFEDYENYDDFKEKVLKKAFYPINGNFTTYTFISEFQGLSFDGTQKTFHDYLILKIDPKTQLIIDGYQYTLEWAEPPAVSDLYKMVHSDKILSDKMKINELEMQLVESQYSGNERILLKENGIIRIK